MPVIYTFPTKVTPLGSDLVLISDSAESLATKNATISSLVTSNAIDVVDTVTASGSGITASPNKGNVVISNTGVTSLTAGANISLSGSTGAITIGTTVPSGLEYSGTWDANTNNPTLASGVGTTGTFYIVAASGSTNLDGITDWKVGDWAIFVESGATDTWQKVDNTSVLNGSGTTGKIPKWSNSNTLTDSVINENNSNIGIGISIPDDKLHVVGDIRVASTSPIIKFDETDTTDENWALINSGGRLSIRTSDDAFSSYNTRVTIKQDGNVGIGATNPLAALQINNTSAKVRFFDASDFFYTEYGRDGIDAYSSTSGTAPIFFKTGGVEKIRISSTGSLGIGTANPTEKLEVSGNLKLNYPTNSGSVMLMPNATNNSQYSLILPSIPSSSDGSKFLQLPSSTTGLQQFQLEWADPRLQVATNINKTRSLNPGSGISMTSTDNGLNVEISSTGGPGTGTLNAFPYWNTTSSLGSSQLTRPNANQLEIVNGSLVISNGAIALKSGSGPSVTLGSPSNAGTNYMIKLPQIPTVAAGYTGGMGLKLPDTLGSSPFQLEWQQPNTKFKDVNSRPFIDGNLSGGISMQQSTGPTIKLEATTNAGPATTYLLPPASQSQAGYVLTLPTGTITSPYQLAWTNASSVTSTNNVTASANSLNLQGSSSVAPTYGAPLNISSSGGAGSGNQTAIYIDQAATANVSGSQGIRMNFKTASVGILVENADSQFSNVANFRNSSNQVVGTISCTSSATTYATSSDYRIKENVVDMTGAVDRVKQLKPSRFNFTADPSKIVDGFLAHEAQEVVPESVTGVKDALYPNGDPLLQGIDQSKIVPLLTGALKELIARIEVLEAKIEVLEAK